MRCGFVWCSSYSSQRTGQVPGSCFLDKDVDVPVLATSWGCRAHHGHGELLGLLFRAVYTGTRPGLTPAIRAGKGWRGRRELAPRCSATRISCMLVRSYRQRHVRNSPVRTTTTTPTPPHFGSRLKPFSLRKLCTLLSVVLSLCPHECSKNVSFGRICGLRVE